MLMQQVPGGEAIILTKPEHLIDNRRRRRQRPEAPISSRITTVLIFPLYRLLLQLHYIWRFLKLNYTASPLPRSMILVLLIAKTSWFYRMLMQQVPGWRRNLGIKLITTAAAEGPKARSSNVRGTYHHVEASLQLRHLRRFLRLTYVHRFVTAQIDDSGAGS
jgi:hypothetical protein